MIAVSEYVLFLQIITYAVQGILFWDLTDL